MEFDMLYKTLMEQILPPSPAFGGENKVTTIIRKPSGFKGDYGAEEVSAISPEWFPQFTGSKKRKKTVASKRR